MRRLWVLAALLTFLSSSALGQTAGSPTFEAGVAFKAITAELVPVLKAELGAVLATYLVEADPNLTLSYSVARFAAGEHVQASLRVAGGLQIFLGEDNLPQGGAGQLGVTFDLVAPAIKSRLDTGLLLGIGTNGLTWAPTVAVTVDVKAVTDLIVKAVQEALQARQNKENK